MTRAAIAKRTALTRLAISAAAISTNGDIFCSASAESSLTAIVDRTVCRGRSTPPLLRTAVAESRPHARCRMGGTAGSFSAGGDRIVSAGNFPISTHQTGFDGEALTCQHRSQSRCSTRLSHPDNARLPISSSSSPYRDRHTQTTGCPT